VSAEQSRRSSGMSPEGNPPRVVVPPIGFERQVWNPSPMSGFTRRERVAGTYESAIPAQIAELTFHLPAALSADAEDAAAEIARFDASAEPGLGALTAVLLRSESASSSQIEQITASARAIAEAELTGSGSANAVVVVDNMRAMTDSVAQAGTLTRERIVDIQRVLLQRSSPQLTGWRTEPVWIGGGGSTPMTADYVAPEHGRIAPAIDDLVRFAARDDLPLLPQIAIAHAQFETIHPFADGNGRTGRAIVQIMLRTKGLTRTATVPISGGLLVAKDDYFAALSAFRDGDVAPIIDQFTHASLRAVYHGRQLANRLDELRQQWRDAVKARSDSTAWKVIDLLPAHPVIDAEAVAQNTNIHPNNVRRAITPLVDAGILVGRQHYKSHKYLYRAPAILELLDNYAADVGRRQR
jgi:Fic family protein